MKFTVGDTVKITGRRANHDFEIGELCVITERVLDAKMARATRLGTRITYLIFDEDAELIEQVVRDGDKQNDPYIVTEYCPNCESEIEMRWSVEELGYRAFCPVCGKRLMLCDACQHTTGRDDVYSCDCDYDTKTDTCKFNKKERETK